MIWVLAPALLVLAAWAPMQTRLVDQAVLATPEGQALPDFEMQRDTILAEARQIANRETRGGLQPRIHRARAADRGSGEPLRLDRRRCRDPGRPRSAAACCVAQARPGVPRPHCGRAMDEWAARRRFPDRDLHDARDRPFAAVRIACASSSWCRRQISCSALTWSPQTAIRADQAGSSGAFGSIPLFWGTILIGAIIAMIVAIPLGLMSAIYLTQYAAPRARAVIKPLLEILAGVPTVVYGYFAALTVAPWIRELGIVDRHQLGEQRKRARGWPRHGHHDHPVRQLDGGRFDRRGSRAMRDGSLALGATRSETIRKVLLPAALPGVVGGVLLAVSRAIGETMIVVMAEGLAANLTANPFESVTTVTVQIVQLLTGDQEFDSAKTLAAFALGLVLFLITLVLNLIALSVVRRYREAYE